MGSELNLPNPSDKIRNKLKDPLELETKLPEVFDVPSKTINLKGKNWVAQREFQIMPKMRVSDCKLSLESIEVHPGAKDLTPYLQITSKKGEMLFIKIDTKNDHFQVDWFSKLREVTNMGHGMDGPRNDLVSNLST